MNNKEYITRYLSWCKNERGYSDNTLIAYKTNLGTVLKMTDKQLHELTVTDLRALLNEIADTKTKKTRNYIYTILKNYYQYLIDVEEIMVTNPILKIAKIKEEHKERRSLSTSQINAILNEIELNGYYRDIILFKFMIQTGLRISEVVNLRNEDVDLSSGFIRVRNGKGNKERYVPIVNSLSEDLNKYNEYKIKEKVTSDNYFFNLRHKDKGITRNNILVMLKKYATYAGINPDVISPHVCRHTFATLMLYKGCDLYVVSKVMGHSSINTTMIYLTNNRFRNKTIMEKYNIFED